MSAQDKKTFPLTLKIEGSKITSERFLRAVNSFFGIVNNVSDDIMGRKDAITWVVSAHEGSMVISASPEARDIKAKEMKRVTTKIRNGIARLEKGSERPEYYSDTSLRHMRDLASIIGDEADDIQRVRIRYGKHENSVSRHTIANIDDILGTKRKEPGSIEGKVTVISDRRSFSVYIDDTLTGQSVRCFVKQEMENKLIAEFRKRIVAVGQVNYRRDGKPISINIEEIRPLGKREDLPTFEDVRGIFGREN